MGGSPLVVRVPTVRSGRALPLVLAAALMAASLAVLGAMEAVGQGVAFGDADVFVSSAGGTIDHFDASGRLVDTLDTRASGEGGGLAFDLEGNLLAASFGASRVSRFDTNGVLLGGFGADYVVHPEVVLRDGAGNVFVGLNDGTRQLLRFDAAGNPTGRLAPAVENRGVDWADLDADQCRLLYTSEGRLIKAYDVCADRQLGDFATLPIGGDNRSTPTSAAYALRIRHNGEVMVATSAAVYRLSAGGEVVQTYELPETGQLLTMNLDADLGSFWVGDHVTGRVARVDIVSGNVRSAVQASGELLGGVAVKGEFLRVDPFLRLSRSTTAVVGEPVTVTAQLLNIPDPGGTVVTFVVTGPNPGIAEVEADEAGVARTIVAGANPGDDSIIARATTASGRAVESNPITVTRVAQPPVRISYGGPTSGSVGNETTLAARVTDAESNRPVAGSTVTFRGRAGEQCSGVTDANGIATCRFTPGGPAGTIVLTVEAAPTAQALGGSATVEFTVAPQAGLRPTVLLYGGPAEAFVADPAVVTARLLDAGTGIPIAGMPVTFTPPAGPACTGTTDQSGVATCSLTLAGPVGNRPLTVSSPGDATYLPVSASAQILVRAPVAPVQGGRAIGISVRSGLIGDLIFADTGDVSSDGASLTEVRDPLIQGPPIDGSASARVVTELGSAEAFSTADVLVNPLGELLAIDFGLVTALARSSCAVGSSGRATIERLSIGGIELIPEPIMPAPNTVIEVPNLGITLLNETLIPRIAVILNEQRAVTTATGTSIEVTAVHVVIEGVVDIFASYSRSEVHACPAAPPAPSAPPGSA